MVMKAGFSGVPLNVDARPVRSDNCTLIADGSFPGNATADFPPLTLRASFPGSQARRSVVRDDQIAHNLAGVTKGFKPVAYAQRDGAPSE
jgi:hypothetical protein